MTLILSWGLPSLPPSSLRLHWYTRPPRRCLLSHTAGRIPSRMRGGSVDTVGCVVWLERLWVQGCTGICKPCKPWRRSCGSTATRWQQMPCDPVTARERCPGQTFRAPPQCTPGSWAPWPGGVLPESPPLRPIPPAGSPPAVRGAGALIGLVCS